MNSQLTFERALKKKHMSLTGPRQAVFDALKHHQSLTTHELIAACMTVDRASVYRTIQLFEELGIIIRIPTGWKYRLELGEAFHEHHHHATCSACGGSIALPEDPALEQRLHALATRRDFLITSHQIELNGLCAACRSNNI